MTPQENEGGISLYVLETNNDMKNTNIMKLGNGFYSIELEGGPVEIVVRRKKDREKLDRLIESIPDGDELLIGFDGHRKDVLLKQLRMTAIMRKYDAPAANEWCVQVFGGIRGMVALYLNSMLNLNYGIAGRLLIEMEMISKTTNILPVIASRAIVDKDGYCIEAMKTGTKG